MNKQGSAHWALTLTASICTALVGCGGSSDSTDTPVPPTPPTVPSMPAEPIKGTNTLKAPILSFTDSGLSVSDGVTFNGLWSVTNDNLGWEYSLDQGRTWTKGMGGFFEVKGDGPKMIWVRSVDDAGNTSDIVMVTCVLDTRPPEAIALTPASDGLIRTLQFGGLETGARWEYSLNEQRTWQAGTGNSLGVLGNGLSALWVRQVDIAGNVSPAQTIRLDEPMTDSWHEASGNPLQPSVVNTTGNRTFLIHGSVVRGDANFVRWDVPKDHRLAKVQLVHYASEDAIAFYAIQRSAVFDAGVDVTRMLVYGHMGPQDLARNAVQGLPNEALGEGPMTLWFQQTGALPTTYAIEISIQPRL